jgi:hypothetical protein
MDDDLTLRPAQPVDFAFCQRTSGDRAREAPVWVVRLLV